MKLHSFNISSVNDNKSWTFSKFGGRHWFDSMIKIYPIRKKNKCVVAHLHAIESHWNNMRRWYLKDKKTPKSYLLICCNMMATIQNTYNNKYLCLYNRFSTMLTFVWVEVGLWNLFLFYIKIVVIYDDISQWCGEFHGSRLIFRCWSWKT